MSELPKSEGVQCVTGEEQRTLLIAPEKNEMAGPKQKQHSVVDVSGEESKIRCCKREVLQKEPGMLGPLIKVNWTWSNRR